MNVALVSCSAIFQCSVVLSCLQTLFWVEPQVSVVHSCPTSGIDILTYRAKEYKIHKSVLETNGNMGHCITLNFTVEPILGWRSLERGRSSWVPAYAQVCLVLISALQEIFYGLSERHSCLYVWKYSYSPLSIKHRSAAISNPMKSLGNESCKEMIACCCFFAYYYY